MGDKVELVSVREAARIIGVHENTLRRWDDNGTLRAVKLPTGVRRFKRRDVERLHRNMHDEGGFSLVTEEGAQAVADLVRLATREVGLEDLDGRFGVAPDGTPRLVIDMGSFERLAGNLAA